jgi:hypothetical protein
VTVIGVRARSSPVLRSLREEERGREEFRTGEKGEASIEEEARSEKEESREKWPLLRLWRSKRQLTRRERRECRVKRRTGRERRREAGEKSKLRRSSSSFVEKRQPRKIRVTLSKAGMSQCMMKRGRNTMGLSHGRKDGERTHLRTSPTSSTGKHHRSPNSTRAQVGLAVRRTKQRGVALAEETSRALGGKDVEEEEGKDQGGSSISLRPLRTGGTPLARGSVRWRIVGV